MNTTEQTLKILAVDDNRTNLHILQVFLKKQGHTVVSAENGEEAVKLFELETPDIVLLDIMMPIMNGFEAARKIKALTPDRWVPVVFLSALNRDENLIEGLEAGADDYLTKPINFVVLEAKLRTIQRSLNLQRQAHEALRRIEAISNNVLDAIITTTDEGNIVAVNRAATKLFGIKTEDLQGHNINLLMPPPYNNAPDAFFEYYLAKGDKNTLGTTRELKAIDNSNRVFPITLGISEVELDEQKMFISVIRDISEAKRNEEKLKENARLLQTYYDQTQSEQQLALRLMEKQLHRSALKDARITYKVLAAENFSGDVVAAARFENEKLYVLLADATGHGLTAAISVLPLLAIFYRMARTGRSLKEIISELNEQLKESMPIGRFVAATLICLDEKSKKGEIWVGGTPEAYLIDRWGRKSKVFASENLALGILNSSDLNTDPVEFTWTPESQLILYSDGLVEASDQSGAQFGSEGLLNAIANTSPDTRFAQVEKALKKHLGETNAADDVSLMLIDCP